LKSGKFFFTVQTPTHIVANNVRCETECVRDQSFASL